MTTPVATNLRSNTMLAWLTQYLWWLTAFSTFLLVVGLMGAFLFVIKMPADYFVRRSREQAADSRRVSLRLLRQVIKNVVGMVLVVVGVLMSLPLVPGPGLLMILAGVSLADFPGKRALELWIVRKRLVLHPLNRLRIWCGQPKLQLPLAKRKKGTQAPAPEPVSK